MVVSFTYILKELSSVLEHVEIINFLIPIMTRESREPRIVHFLCEALNWFHMSWTAFDRF